MMSPRTPRAVALGSTQNGAAVVEVARVVETVLPTDFGEFRAYGYREERSGQEHLALALGNLEHTEHPGLLTRIHSECLSGDVFGSGRCDCGPQLRDALAAVAEEGVGLVIYVRGHEGRGIGLVNKLRAYSLQDRGVDTVDANLMLGLPADGRNYGAALGILHDLGISAVRLLTNNPAKVAALQDGGVKVEKQVPLLTAVTAANAFYLETKMHRFRHTLGPQDGRPAARAGGSPMTASVHGKTSADPNTRAHACTARDCSLDENLSLSHAVCHAASDTP